MPECIHDLDPAACSVCSGRDKRAEPDPSGFGPAIEARFDGICRGCDGLIRVGDMIRFDGEGSWVHA